MIDPPDLRLLYATDLSEASLRASLALSSLAARCRLDVVFVHVARPDRRRDAARMLEAFVTCVAPDYTSRRVLIESHDPVQAIAALCARARFDLIAAPASGRSRFGRLPGTSFRGRLLQRCHVPLWSGGPGFSTADRPLAAVGCVLDLDDRPEPHLRQAWTFADRMGAALHVTSTVRSIDDGAIARVAASEGPLTPEEAASWIRATLPAGALASLDLSIDDRRTRLHQRLAAHRPDVVFVGRPHATSAIWPARYPRFLDRLPYPVICLGAAGQEPAWSFEETPSWLGTEPTGALASAS